MMMSLVAYGSSDDDSEAEDEVNTVVQASKPKQNGSTDVKVQMEETQSVNSIEDTTHTDITFINSSGKADALQQITTGLNGSFNGKNELEFNPSNSKELFSKLPAPSSVTNFLSRDSILSIKRTQQKGPVKILVPSLPEFDEEDEPQAKKKPQVQKSSSGTKLMSMLPAPKGGTFTKETKPSLVPQSIARKPAPPVKPKPPVTKVTSAPPVKPKRGLTSYDDSGDESGGEGAGASTDFFSLTADHGVSTAEVTSNFNSGLPDQSMLYSNQPTTSSYDIEQQSTYSEYSAEYSELSSAPAELQADSDQGYIGFGSNDLQLDDEAIKKLCGRKGRREENVQIIDLNGDEIMPDSREWLTKQLTQEKPSRSHRKGFGPSSQQRRKHQITYLAFQAKENELELQNQWANNRQSRRQTQSKYGF